MLLNTATDFIDDDPQAANSAFISLAFFNLGRNFFLGSRFLCFLHSCLLSRLLRCLFNSFFLGLACCFLYLGLPPKNSLKKAQLILLQIITQNRKWNH